jgi:hypothetical protein
MTRPTGAASPAVDLFWIPLGAGDTTGCVRWNGRLFETVAARREHRPVTALYHSALQVHDYGSRYLRHPNTDEARTRRLLDAVPQVPVLIWGRDQLGTGDVHPPTGGRAPGWTAGLAAAHGRRLPCPRDHDDGASLPPAHVSLEVTRRAGAGHGSCR